jgi:hypothetical protein
MASGEVQFSHRPQLNQPVLVAAWPGIGRVALRAAGYLKEQLGATEFARIDSMPFFDLGGVLVEEDIIQPPSFPQNVFSAWQHPDGGQDIILFTAEAQPSNSSYRFAHMVLDVASEMGAQSVFTMAAALLDELPETPRVWAAVSHPGRRHDIEKYGVALKGDFYIAGMNGLLLAVAQERSLEASCLLGETPRFASEVENPTAALAVLEVLAPLLGLPVDLTDLRKEATQAQVELKRLLAESRKEFIDRFTVPLWENKDEEERA